MASLVAVACRRGPVVEVDVGVGWVVIGVEELVWKWCLVGGELRGMAAARSMLVLAVVMVVVDVRGYISLLAFR